MAEIALSSLASPISETAPCGVDLDAEGDPDFLNFLARAEGLLPASFFSGPEGRPLDRSAIDLAAEFKAAQPLLERTRDIRLLVLLAKFSALNRDLNAFIACVGAVAQLLQDKWDEVHPRGEAGDFGIRMAVLDTLNDVAPVVMPLQYMPLLQSRRFGAISYRHFMFANGEAAPREGEETIDQVNIDRAFADAELTDLVAARSSFETLRTALTAIQDCGQEKAGPGQAIKLDKPLALVDKIFTLLNDIIAKRDPSAAVATPSAVSEAPEGAAAPSVAVGPIRSNAEAATALAAVDAYFCRHEPSNPALLLVRQVQQLIGKSLLEVLQILIPAQLSEAKFHLGGSQAFEIPVESLAPLATIEASSEEASADGGNPEGGADSSGDGPGAGADGGPEGNADGGGSEDRAAEAIPATPPRTSTHQAGIRQQARTRQEAFALIDQVAAYFRVAEPSSPIALILDRARGFANRDFLTVLKDLLAKPSQE